MPVILIFALLGLYFLVLWAMYRYRRAKTMRLLASLIRRQLPLESTLAAISEGRVSAEERLTWKISQGISRGQDLADVLLGQRVLDRLQATALRLSQEKGAAAEMLDVLSLHTLTDERRMLRTGVMSLYPLLMGTVLLLNVTFFAVFIEPKFEQMIREMNLAISVPDARFGTVFVAALFIWGLISSSLNVSWLGIRIWYWVPWLGEHFRMEDQARFARTFGLLLAAGITAEEAIDEIVSERSGGRLQRSLVRIQAALNKGTPLVDAFRMNGAWREELLWALNAIAHGAAPRPALEHVAQVLEEKVDARFSSLHRICTPVAIIITAAGVGTLAWTIFTTMDRIKWGML